ncbi:hypothetical protein [Marinovum sp.]|uniref:hypothetical protein n=1 Tax=Marinovum sp. TaxID=2024839 RepID=UPI002B276319|nr:hypothetical protein [Marinovum sp.]
MPKTDHSSEKNESDYQRAVLAAREWLDELQSIGVTSEILSNSSFTHFLTLTTPGIRRIAKEGGQFVYEIDDLAAANLCGAAQRLPEAYDVLREVCTTNVFHGAVLPAHCRMAASQIIRGSFPNAKRTGPPIGGNFVMRMLAYNGAKYCRDAFQLTLTRNEERSDGLRLSACDAVVEAAKSQEIHIEYKNLADWCLAKKFLGFRERADAIMGYAHDLELVRVGALKQPNSPFGPFPAIGHMRTNRK